MDHSQIAQNSELLSKLREKLSSRKGAILSFSAFRRLAPDASKEDIAFCIEELSSKNLRILKKVYFFENEDMSLVQIPNESIKNFFLYNADIQHPTTNYPIENPDEIIMEFEVL